MRSPKLFTVIMVFVSYSCSSSSDKNVKTFHPASDGSHQDRIYDPENNVIIYVNNEMGIYGPTPNSVKVLDLKTKSFKFINDITVVQGSK